MNSFEVHGPVDVGRLTRIRSTGFSPRLVKKERRGCRSFFPR